MNVGYFTHQQKILFIKFRPKPGLGLNYNKPMSIRKTPLVNGEYYHVFNRGVDKRDIFTNR